MKKLLNKLKIPNEEKLLEFLVTYSRFEYSLKRTGYIKSTNGNAEANWESFISQIKDKFIPNNTDSLAKAVDYLLKFPAQQQIIKDGRLDFSEHSSTKEGSIALRLFHCIRITRNNLFHGGKFPYKPAPELARNSKLIEYSIIVLKEFVQLDPEVNEFFWEIEK